MATSIPSTLHLRNQIPYSILTSPYKRPSSTFACVAKKRISFFDQILEYIEGAICIQSVMKANAWKLAEEEESKLLTSGVPYTIIRVGMLQDTPGVAQGFCFDEDCSGKGTLGKDDVAMICVEALSNDPRTRFVLEVVNREERVCDWGSRLAELMEKGGTLP